MTKIWTWLKAHWKWLVAGLVFVVALLLGWKKAAGLARGIMGKDEPKTPPPGTMTHKEAEATKEEIVKAGEIGHVKREDARAAERRKDDEWLNGGEK